MQSGIAQGGNPLAQIHRRAGPPLAVLGQPIERDYTAAELLRRPDVGYEALMTIAGPSLAARAEQFGLSGQELAQAIEQVVIQTRYAGYIVRQQLEIDRQGLNEGQAIPDDLDYAEVPGLSREVAQKLAAQRPATIGQASRISGVTPAAVSILMVHLKKRRAAGKAVSQQ